MKKINWFKYGRLMRYAFDLARIFPIIIKQRGTSKLISGISSHIIEASQAYWLLLSNIDQQVNKLLFILSLAWI